jgi:hypothetical protein
LSLQTRNKFITLWKTLLHSGEKKDGKRKKEKECQSQTLAKKNVKTIIKKS